MLSSIRCSNGSSSASTVSNESSCVAPMTLTFASGSRRMSGPVVPEKTLDVVAPHCVPSYVEKCAGAADITVCDCRIRGQEGEAPPRYGLSAAVELVSVGFLWRLRHHSTDPAVQHLFSRDVLAWELSEAAEDEVE